MAKDLKQRPKIWSALPALYEADYSECIPQQKSAFQEFAQDCFEKVAIKCTILEPNEELKSFFDCFVGLFPRFDFDIKLTRFIFLRLKSFLLVPEKVGMSVLWVIRLIRALNGAKDDTGPPAAGKWREYQLLIQALMLRGEPRLDKLNEILVLNPENILALSLRGNYYNLKGNSEGELDALNKILTLKPNHPFFKRNRGLLYVREGKYDVALKDYNDQLELRNNDVTFLVLRSKCLYYMGKFEDAIRDIDQALKLNPKSVKALNWRSILFYHDKHFEKALEVHSRILELSPDHQSAWVNRATCYLKQGKFDEALNIFNQVLTKNPKQAYSLQGRGECFRAMGRLDEAIKDLTTSIELLPDQDAFLYRSHCHLQKGNFDAAQKDLKSAFEHTNKMKSNYLRDKKLEECRELKGKILKTLEEWKTNLEHI
jgi:tetratricopeptide (TPR) repeat protein